MNPQEAWLATMGQLQLQMNKGSFETWVHGARVLAYKDGAFTIGVPNEHAREFLDKRLRPTIERTLGDVMDASGSPITVEFTVWSPVDLYGGPPESYTRPRLEIDLPGLLPPAPPPVNLPALRVVERTRPAAPQPSNAAQRKQRSQEPARPYAKMDMLQVLELLPDLSGAATKCVVCVAAHMGPEDRDFWGERLSLRQISRETGYSRRSSVTKGMRELLEGGLVEAMPPWEKDENGELSPAQNYHRYRPTALFYRNRGSTPWYEAPTARGDEAAARQKPRELDGDKMYPPRLQNVANAAAHGPNGYILSPDSNIGGEVPLSRDADSPPPQSSSVATKGSHSEQMDTFCSQTPDPMATKGSHPEQMATFCSHSGPEAQAAWLSAFGVKAVGPIVALGHEDAYVLGALLDRAREIRDGVIKAEQAPKLLFATLKRGDPVENLMQYCARLPVAVWTDLVLYAVAQVVADEVPPLPERLQRAWSFWAPAHTVNPEYAMDNTSHLKLDYVPEHLIAGARAVLATDGGFDAWLEALRAETAEEREGVGER